jgi:hypothetical protein
MRLFLLLLTLACSCAAQTRPDSAVVAKMLADAPLAKVEPQTHNEIAKQQREPIRRREIVEHAALFAVGETFSMLDAYTTRQGINLPRVHESDPFFRPFVRSNALYAVQSGEIGALAFLGWKMHHSRNKFLCNTWWIPQTAQIGANFQGWRMNRRLIAQPNPTPAN